MGDAAHLAADRHGVTSASMTPDRTMWTLYLHLGLREVGGQRIARTLRDNASVLGAQGLAVITRDAGGGGIRGLARASSAADTDRIVASRPDLIRLREDQIQQLKEDVTRLGGQMVVVVLLTSAPEIAAQQHAARLVAGSTNPLSGVVLKRINYIPPIQRWERVLGQRRVHVRATSLAGPVSGAVALLADEVGIDVDHVVLPRGRLGPRLTQATAEALRRVNIQLSRLRWPADEARHARQEAVAILERAGIPADGRLLPPEDVAQTLVSGVAAAANQLTARMPPNEAGVLLRAESSPQPVPVARLAQLFEQLRESPRLAQLLPPDPTTVEEPDAVLVQRRDAVVAAVQDPSGNTLSEASSSFRSAIEHVRGFRLVGKRRTSAVIPPTVVQYWEPLPPPDYMRSWIDSWHRVGTTGSSVLESRDSARAALGEAAGSRGLRAFDLTNHPAARADLFRYAYLLMNGGWYVDADHEALIPIDVVLSWPVDHVLVIRKERYPNGFLGCVPDSPLMRQALDTACANLVGSEGGMPIMQATGPGMFTHVVRRYLESDDASAAVIPGRVAFAGLIQQIHNDAAYKVTGHWRDAGLPRGAPE
jgi:hypothetical protein